LSLAIAKINERSGVVAELGTRGDKEDSRRIVGGAEGRGIDPRVKVRS